MAQPSPLKLSPGAWQLYVEQVIRPVTEDMRPVDPLRLGFSIDEISDRVLEKGRTDFSVGYSSKRGTLTPDDKVKLYCFVNMKQHLFEAISTLRGFKARLQPLFESEVATRFIDLGCGPGTAALAAR